MQSTAGGWGGACRAASFRVLASSLPNDAGGCKYCAWERFFLGAASMAAHRGGAGLGCHPGQNGLVWIPTVIRTVIYSVENMFCTLVQRCTRVASPSFTTGCTTRMGRSSIFFCKCLATWWEDLSVKVASTVGSASKGLRGVLARKSGLHTSHCS
jgi:hypothetical protein